MRVHVVWLRVCGGTGCSSVGGTGCLKNRLLPLLPPSQSFLENSRLAAGFGNHSLIAGWKGKPCPPSDDSHTVTHTCRFSSFLSYLENPFGWYQISGKTGPPPDVIRWLTQSLTRVGSRARVHPFLPGEFVGCGFARYQIKTVRISSALGWLTRTCRFTSLLYLENLLFHFHTLHQIVGRGKPH